MRGHSKIKMEGKDARRFVDNCSQMVFRHGRYRENVRSNKHWLMILRGGIIKVVRGGALLVR